MPVISSLGRTRAGLVLVTSLSGTAFAWAAAVLPSRPGTALGLLAAALSAAHAATLLVALFWPGRLSATWRALAIFSLGAGAVFLGALGWTSSVLMSRFGSLGSGVSALLGAIALLLLLATWPLGLWGLLATRTPHDPG
jgi:hypothetical protein